MCRARVLGKHAEMLTIGRVGIHLEKNFEGVGACYCLALIWVGCTLHEERSLWNITSLTFYMTTMPHGDGILQPVIKV